MDRDLHQYVRLIEFAITEQRSTTLHLTLPLHEVSAVTAHFPDVRTHLLSVAGGLAHIVVYLPATTSKGESV